MEASATLIIVFHESSMRHHQLVSTHDEPLSSSLKNGQNSVIGVVDISVFIYVAFFGSFFTDNTLSETTLASLITSGFDVVCGK